VLVLAGCFGSTETNGCGAGKNGLAGNGTFSYDCVGPADPQCDLPSLFTLRPVPSAVAVGALFRLRFDSGGTLMPVSAKAVGRRGDAFIARATGPVGFVVVAEDGAEAVDAVRLTFVEPDALEIDGLVEGASTSSFQAWSQHFAEPRVAVGSQFTVRAVARRASQAIAGAISDVVWTVDPSDAADLGVGSEGLVEVNVRRAGPITIGAAHRGRTARVQVEAYDRSDSDGEDAGRDAGSDAAESDLDAGDGGDQ
jgi:hypothetical protein